VQSQSTRLSELLRTKAFLNDVASKTSLAALTSSSAGQARFAELVSRGVTVGGAAAATAAAPATNASEHLLVIKVQANTAQLSYELCKAIIDTYQEKTAADQSDQASLATDFYQSQLQDAQQALAKSTGDLRRYVASHQSDDSSPVTDPSQQSLTAAMLDPRLGALQDTVQAAQNTVKNAQTALNQAQQAALTSAQGQQYGFQVIDAPELATAATPQIKKIVIYPIAAAVAGLGLAAMLLVILVASDRSIRSETDVLPGVRVLGTVPGLYVKRLPKQLQATATRRAIGAPAGAALPAAAGAK
jgi:hypothetical protein